MTAVPGTSTLSGAWLTTAQQDAVIGYPDTPLYPGPVTTDHSGIMQAQGDRSPGPAGQPAPDGFPGQQYQDNLAGGTITDTVAELGHSGPVASFDAQTEPFAPPGPVAGIHGLDTGGTYRTGHVPMPSSPGWWRRTATMQTFNRQSFVTDTAGWRQTVPNGRQDYNQDQGQAADGYDPKWLPYSERPLQARFAAEAYPVENVAGLSGYLPDMYAMGGQGNYVYTAPPDPSVTNQPPAAAAPASQPVLGMEYVLG